MTSRLVLTRNPRISAGPPRSVAPLHQIHGRPQPLCHPRTHAGVMVLAVALLRLEMTRVASSRAALQKILTGTSAKLNTAGLVALF